MELTEDMLDAIMIKVDSGTYDDRGDSSSDLDSDLNDDHYRRAFMEPNDPSNDSSDPNRKSSESSCSASDGSPPPKTGHFSPYNLSDAKILKSEVRLTPIDISLLQSHKIRNTSFLNVESGSLSKSRPTNSESASTVNGNPAKMKSSASPLSKHSAFYDQVIQSSRMKAQNPENSMLDEESEDVDVESVSPSASCEVLPVMTERHENCAEPEEDVIMDSEPVSTNQVPERPPPKAPSCSPTTEGTAHKSPDNSAQGEETVKQSAESQLPSSAMSSSNDQANLTKSPGEGGEKTSGKESTTPSIIANSMNFRRIAPKPTILGPGFPASGLGVTVPPTMEKEAGKIGNKQEENKTFHEESDDESDNDGLCIDLKADEVETSMKVSGQVLDSTSPQSGSLSPKMTASNLLKTVQTAGTKAQGSSEQSSIDENKVTFYGESNVSSILTVQLLCASCVELAETESPRVPSIKHIVVPEKECEICRMKVSSHPTTPTETGNAPSSTNLDNVIKYVAEDVLGPVANKTLTLNPKTGRLEGGSKNPSSSKSMPPKDFIVVKSNKNALTSQSIIGQGSNVLIKDDATKSAFKNATQNLKTAGMTTLDGKLYKVIFLPKTTSGSTAVCATAPKTTGEGAHVPGKIVTSDPVGLPKVPINKLIPLTSSCILTPAESVPTSNFKKGTEVKVSGHVITAPNRTVFTSPKASTFTTSLIPNSFTKKPPALYSIIKPDTLSKVNAADRLCAKSIAPKRFSLDSTAENSERVSHESSSGRNSLKVGEDPPGIQPRENFRGIDSANMPENTSLKHPSADSAVSATNPKFISLHDYMSKKNLPSSFTAAQAMKVVHQPDKIRFLPKFVSTSINKLPTTVSFKNDEKQGPSDDVPMKMKDGTGSKRQRLSQKDSLIHDLDQVSKRLILESSLLPPFAPSLPESIYDANSPGFKHPCAYCPDIFPSAGHLQNHMNRRSVLMKYDCPLCLKVLVTAFNRCQMRQHWAKHSIPVDLARLTIEPLPLSLFNLHLFYPPSAVSSATRPLEHILPPPKPAKKRIRRKMTSLVNSEPKATPSTSAEALKQVVPPPPATSPKKDPRKTTDLWTSCHDCKKSFASLHAHLQDSGKPNSKFTCECKTVCTTACSLKAHQRLHNRTPPHSCPECGASYLSAPALEKHFKKSCYHPFKKNSYECLQCRQNFSILPKLELHILQHHTSQMNVCNICKLWDADSGSITEHMRREHWDVRDSAEYRIMRFMKCEFCPDIKFLRHQCHQHIQTHTAQQTSFKPNYYFQCSACSNYKTVTKIDFGQHLDFCLFSKSLRLMEAEKDNYSDSEEEAFALESKDPEIEASSSSNEAPSQVKSPETVSVSINQAAIIEKSFETTIPHTEDGNIPQVKSEDTEMPESNEVPIEAENSEAAVPVSNTNATLQSESEIKMDVGNDVLSENPEPVSEVLKNPSASEGSTPTHDVVDLTSVSPEKVPHENSLGKPPESSESVGSLPVSNETKNISTNIDHRTVASKAKNTNAPKEKTAPTILLRKSATVMQCKYCPAKFRDPQKVFTHLKTEHPEVIGPIPGTKRKEAPPVSAPIVSAPPKVAKLEDETAQSYKCSKCTFIGSTYEDLFKHMETHKTIFKCSECKERFVALPSLEKHLIIKHNFDIMLAKHTVESKHKNTEVVKENGAFLAKQGFYQCATCYKNFTTEKAFSQHFRTHGLAFVTGSASLTHVS